MRLASMLAAVACLCSLPAAAQVLRTNEIVVVNGVIATANVSQVALNQYSSRAWFICQNPSSANESLFVGLGLNDPASTAGGSVELQPGGSISFLAGIVPTNQVNVAAATAGHRFTCKAGS